jgi:hypothetical protein
MRNLMIFTMAGAGAWVMVQHSQQLAATILPVHAAGQNPMTALFFLPALLVGGLVGALVGGLVAPLR